MKTLTISTNNEKMWTMLLSYTQKYSFDFQTIKEESSIQTPQTENYVLYLAQNPLNLPDAKPLTREEIYE